MANRDPEGRCPLDDDQLREVINERKTPPQTYYDALDMIGEHWGWLKPTGCIEHWDTHDGLPPDDFDDWITPPDYEPTGPYVPNDGCEDTVKNLIDRVTSVAVTVLTARDRGVFWDEKYALRKYALTPGELEKLALDPYEIKLLALDPNRSFRWGKKAQEGSMTPPIYLLLQVAERCWGLRGFNNPYKTSPRVLRKRLRKGLPLVRVKMRQQPGRPS